MYNVSGHVLAQIMKLDVENRNKFQLYYQGKEKETNLAWIFFLFLGALYGYLGSWGKQILFWITGGGFGIWALILFFQVNSKVREYNDKLALEILAQM